MDDTAKNLLSGLYPAGTTGLSSILSVYYMTSTGSFDSDHVLAVTKSAGIFRVTDGSTPLALNTFKLQVMPTIETYSGKWNSTGFGTGIILHAYANQETDALDNTESTASLAPSNWPTFSGVTTPTVSTAFGVANLANTTSYLKAAIKGFSPGAGNGITTLYKSSDSLTQDTTPFLDAANKLRRNGFSSGDHTVAEFTAAGYWPPCPEWKAISTIQ